MMYVHMYVSVMIRNVVNYTRAHSWADCVEDAYRLGVRPTAHAYFQLLQEEKLSTCNHVRVVIM